ncbi:TetR/AcrR family transcriptional regulator [Streptomyces sp. NPDC005794]|uniref:TetR/AcrR family transcriptional regulator n=1 Tax=Streptomyces sp. NPDC005794 TaxID=3364733 RepID=UPI0036BD732B
MARTKSFEPAVALEKAMLEFWQHGYERTSTDTLTAAMGVGKRSLYDTFGSKHDLYLRTLTTYIEHAEASHSEAVEAVPGGGLAGIRALLRSRVEIHNCPSGCYAVNAATERPDDQEVLQAVSAYFTRSRDVIAWLLRQEERWAGVGAEQRDSAADTIHNAWLGLRVQARLGCPDLELDTGTDDLLTRFR